MNNEMLENLLKMQIYTGITLFVTLKKKILVLTTAISSIIAAIIAIVVVVVVIDSAIIFLIVFLFLILILFEQIEMSCAFNIVIIIFFGSYGWRILLTSK